MFSQNLSALKVDKLPLQPINFTGAHSGQKAHGVIVFKIGPHRLQDQLDLVDGKRLNISPRYLHYALSEAYLSTPGSFFTVSETGELSQDFELTEAVRPELTLAVDALTLTRLAAAALQAAINASLKQQMQLLVPAGIYVVKSQLNVSHSSCVNANLGCEFLVLRGLLCASQLAAALVEGDSSSLLTTHPELLRYVHAVKLSATGSTTAMESEFGTPGAGLAAAAASGTAAAEESAAAEAAAEEPAEAPAAEAPAAEAPAAADEAAEEEAAAEAEAAARAALEALHKAQALAGRRLEEQVWDEDVAEEQFDPLALVALKADVVSARSRAVARIALHCIALH